MATAMAGQGMSDASGVAPVAKQLDFYGDEVPAEMKPVRQARDLAEVRDAQDKPSYESFKRAFDKIVEITEERFDTIKRCAATAATTGGGEAGLRRMKDHFRSLKVIWRRKENAHHQHQQHQFAPHGSCCSCNPFHSVDTKPPSNVHACIVFHLREAS